MNGQPGFSTEQDGKRSFTRVSGVAALTVLLLVFIWAAYKEQWSTVETMFISLLVFVSALYGTNKAPAIVQAAKGQGETVKAPPVTPVPPG